MADERDIEKAENEGMPTPDDTRLLPCPFCGGAGFEERGLMGAVVVRCANLDCKVSVIAGPFTSSNLAAVAWNTRHG
ncbi:MAG: Lar family restriction alleviation protein [Anaerolineae bacterium]|nr:Lar family restriction alleviation protein [Phycisphaerae bacterium]